MASSEFWRNLAEQFRSLPYAEYLSAEWQFVVGSKARTWRLVGEDYGLHSRFAALAVRGASELEQPGANNLLDTWFDAILLIVSNINSTWEDTTNADGTDGPRITKGTVWRLCEVSADFCNRLEVKATQEEFNRRHIKVSSTAPPPISPPRPAAPIPPLASVETIAAQIQRLRIESKWTIERLAAKVGLDESTVKRHLAGKQTPHLSTISLYEQAFSKALKKEVVINKTP
jgi:ribosome-binding protein aMBF1 (putative translation factor)